MRLSIRRTVDQFLQVGLPDGGRVDGAAVHAVPVRAGAGSTVQGSGGVPITQDAIGSPIRLTGVEKSYGMVQAVKRVSIDVAAGEFVSLLGPSGSGKTSLLMMIAGFELPTGGSITIGNRDVTSVPPNRRDIGIVFQRYALFPHKTVAENIAFPLRMRKVDKAEIARHVREALELVKLDGYGDRLPGQLSGGQQQRVALARAIVFRPPVLLMDEPLGALDKKLREHMQLELKRLQRQLGATVIYVTHDQEEALTMSERVAVMNHGRLEQIGSPMDLYEDPRNPFVADFVGETNLLDVAVVASDAEGVTVEVDPGFTVRARPATGVGRIPIGPARMAVRPEKIHFSQGGDGVQAFVRDIVYAGANTNIYVTCGSGFEIHLRQTGIARLAPGDAVSLSWNPADAIVFPGSQGPGSQGPGSQGSSTDGEDGR